VRRVKAIQTRDAYPVTGDQSRMTCYGGSLNVSFVTVQSTPLNHSFGPDEVELRTRLIAILLRIMGEPRPDDSINI
jgi:hypothetical protein